MWGTGINKALPLRGLRPSWRDKQVSGERDVLGTNRAQWSKHLILWAVQRRLKEG